MASVALSQEAIRYIAARPPGQSKFVLWSSSVAARQCGHALLKNQDVRKWCEEGMVSGTKPKLGTLDPGTRVERLQSTECDDMAQIKVLDGPRKGRVGCTTLSALTTVKPCLAVLPRSDLCSPRYHEKPGGDRESYIFRTCIADPAIRGRSRSSPLRVPRGPARGDPVAAQARGMVGARGRRALCRFRDPGGLANQG